LDSRISISDSRTDRRILLSGDVWRLAITSIKGTWRQSNLLLWIGLIVPQLSLNLWLDLTSLPVVDELRALFTSKWGASGSPLILGELLGPAAHYFWRLGLLALSTSLIGLSSYLGIIQTQVDYLRNQPPRGAFAAWLKGLRRSIQTSIILFLLCFFVLLAGQVMIVPALLIGVLGLMIPTILMCEEKGIGHALRSALLIRYIRGTRLSGWSVIFNIMSIGAFLYGTMAATGLLAELILGLDEVVGLSRGLWDLRVGGSGLSVIYLVVSFFEPILSMTWLSLIPALTTSLYFIVRRDDEGRTIAQV